MSGENEFKTVRDLMTHDVISVHPSTHFKEIVQTLRANRIGAVPVVDTSGQVVGVVSETDLLPKEEPPGALAHHLLESKTKRTLRRKAQGLVAADLMTTPAIIVTPETTIRDAVHILIEDHINHLPVVDPAGNLVGIVSRADLLRLFAREDVSIGREVRQKVTEATHLLDATKVEISVNDGIVTLSGEIDRKSDAERLIAMVRDVDGVVGFDDRLRVWWDDTLAGPFQEAVLSQYGGSSLGPGW